MNSFARVFPTWERNVLSTDVKRNNSSEKGCEAVKKMPACRFLKDDTKRKQA